MNTQALEKHYPLFNEIIRILPGAIIAGGFIRDTLMDRRVGDLDILWDGGLFSALTPAQAKELSTLLNTEIGWEPAYERMLEEYEGEEEGRNSHMTALYEGEEVDIIVVPDVKAHVHDFPDSISKVWYGSDGLITMSDFVYSHANKEIKYRIGAPTARLDKLKMKYPDYMALYVLGEAKNS